MKKNFIKSKKNYLSGCSYGFFTRNGGYSDGIYKSLNCSRRADDSNVNTSKNRKKVAGAFLGTIVEYYDYSLYAFSAGILAEKFFHLNQIQ